MAEVVQIRRDDPADNAGQAILDMLRRAASVAEQNTQHAISTAHKLSMQLRAAEDRIRELESHAENYRERADRAEEWLRRIANDLEQTFNTSRAPSVPNHVSADHYAPTRSVR